MSGDDSKASDHRRKEGTPERDDDKRRDEGKTKEEELQSQQDEPASSRAGSSQAEEAGHCPVASTCSDNGKQDPLIMKSARFLAEDEARGKKFAEHFGGVGKIEKSSCSVDGELCLPKEGNAKVRTGRGEDRLTSGCACNGVVGQNEAQTNAERSKGGSS